MTTRLRAEIEGFSPGYFALVMATGIVSLAAHFCGMDSVARPLLYLNVIAFPALWVITLARLVLYPKALLSDLGKHSQGAGFLTQVAGACVLGSQLVILASAQGPALALWLLGLALWLVLIYAFFAAMTVAEKKPPFEDGIGGSWLLVVVSTESVGVLGALLAPGRPAREGMLFVSLLAYLLGAMLYVLLTTLILYRWLFFSMPADKLPPPYWINMGALAITTLAGSRLILCSGEWWLLASIRPFLLGLTLFFWATACWWIPLLLVLGFWRHVLQRVPIVYGPQYWSLVFPLGMYTVATVQLRHASGIEMLSLIPQVFVWPALLAWTLAFVGMLRALARALGLARA